MKRPPGFASQAIVPAETTKTDAGDAYLTTLAGASGRRGRGHAPRVTFAGVLHPFERLDEEGRA